MSELARWQGRYAVPEYIFGEEPNAFLAAQKHLLPKSGKALAVADGEARNGVWLAQQGLDVTSIDFSSNAQEKARALAKKRGVNITLGLPILRTSVDHGTAFDIAGKGIADANSLVEAAEYAYKLINGQRAVAKELAA